ncbi:hypothetical protein ACFXCZ_26960 [Streptomyces sp. NPDC059396]|uniref:hypothetical protein n=1 Tax=Streptomyces sp. NPDC059396 TaxID=3346819 RepID=UPI00369D43A4
MTSIERIAAVSRTVRLAVASLLLAFAAVIAPAATASADDHAPQALTQGDVGWGSTEATTPETALTQGDVGWG